MRNYELVIIIQTELDEADTSSIIEKVRGWITESGGSVDKIDRWGNKKLAYQIRKQRQGYYVLMNVQMEPSYVRELEHNLQFVEPVLRFLMTASS